MFGTISKIETYTITILVRTYCAVKFQKIFLNGVKAPLELGLKVRYEVDESKNNKLPMLIEIEEYEYENCADCGQSHEIHDPQYVSSNTIKTRYYSLNYIQRINEYTIFRFLCILSVQYDYYKLISILYTIKYFRYVIVTHTILLTRQSRYRVLPIKTMSMDLA